MRESVIEAYLVRRVKALGGEAYKFTSPSRRNVPDRIVIYGGRVIFVELKAPGEKPTSGQRRELQRLSDLGQEAVVIDSKEKADLLICLLTDMCRFKKPADRLFLSERITKGD